nr:MAG TPA: hypothetical protein [Caudoviricetes sp.]
MFLIGSSNSKNAYLRASIKWLFLSSGIPAFLLLHA